MEDKMTRINNMLNFIDQIRPYVNDDEALGRIRVDLHDLVEACEWLLSNIQKNTDKTMTEDELETFLIELDINYIQHASFHIKSLKKEIVSSLKKFPVD
ncbi:MAG: hypothetical protein ABI810_16290 [Sphingomonas bacterium]